MPNPERLKRDELVRERFKLLRRQGVKVVDAVKLIADETQMTPSAVQSVVYENHRKKKALIEAAKAAGLTIETDPLAYATSTLYRRDTEDGALLEWVKRSKGDERHAAEEMVRALAEDLPKLPPLPQTRTDFNSDAIAVYPMGDPHFGMLADMDETEDADFNVKIAERDLCEAIHRLVESSPATEEALIINLGDFFHSDNMEGRTARSGHSLDTDSRWAKVLRIGVKAVRRSIESALMKHSRVTVINAIGNHDDHSSMMLSVLLANVYENEPRVRVIDSPTAKHYYSFGKNLFGVHHGHTIKPERLPLQMAVDRPDEWAGARERRWFCGHVHSQRMHEIDGVVVEYFRTLAPKDAWHASMGYKAGRDMRAMVFHKEFGLTETHVLSVGRLYAMREQEG